MQLYALDHFTDDDSGPSAGSAVAAAITSGLSASEEEVVLSLRGTRGLASSFYNTLLLDLVARFGLETIRERLRFEFDNKAQRWTFDRSMAQVVRLAETRRTP
jgi:hypothetical protein